MTRKKTEGAELRWREILKRQAGSGLSVREFCATEGVSQPSFYAWRSKLRERPCDSGRSPKTRRPQEAVHQGAMFVPLNLLDATQSLEILHPLGYRIQVTGEVNPATLRQVIAALDERGAR